MKLIRMVALLPLLLAGALAWGQPCVQILSPQPEEILPGPDVTVHFDTSGIQFSPGGFNLHFMLDEEPFAVQYNPLHPHVFRDVRPGTHTIRVYAADRLHQSVPGTLSVVTFHVAYPNDENRPEPGEPLLTYNLPQGEYMGLDAGDILLNFMVTGVDLSKSGFRVNYYVDGRRYVAYDCNTYPLPTLTPGHHRIRLELLDPKGRLVPGAFNRAERVILVSPDATPRRRLPGEPPPSQPTIPTIHGPMSSGLPWVAHDEAPAVPRGRTTGRISVSPAEPSASGEFRVRRDNIPAQDIESVVRNEDEVDEVPSANIETERVTRETGEEPRAVRSSIEIREVEPRATETEDERPLLDFITTESVRNGERTTTRTPTYGFNGTRRQPDMTTVRVEETETGTEVRRVDRRTTDTESVESSDEEATETDDAPKAEVATEKADDPDEEDKTPDGKDGEAGRDPRGGR